MKTITICVLRKGATKWSVLMTDRYNYLSICQIFESTNDVDKYTVHEHIAKGWPVEECIKDLHLPHAPGFSKWVPTNQIRENY